MKIAIVCDWLVVYAGAERVLEEILNCFPQADLFAVVDFVPPDQRAFLQDKIVKTTFIQKLPFARKFYRHYLPLMPLAIEQLDVSQYDLVISSSHAVAKGVITSPGQRHVSYVHTPIRYAWDLQHQYLQESGLDRGIKGWLAKYLLHRIRLWDQRTVNNVDQFIANSHYIAKRITKTYRREAEVIHPPVNITRFTPRTNKEDFYLTASRMVPYKKIDLIVEAFTTMPDKQLIVIGDGPDMAKIKGKAGSNVKILGFQPSEVLADYMQRARAFVFAAEEDFGIVPLEAQACATPVIAFGKGGALETIRGIDAEKPTGVFFREQNIDEICAAVKKCDAEYGRFQSSHFQENVAQFSPEIFREKFMRIIAAT